MTLLWEEPLPTNAKDKRNFIAAILSLIDDKKTSAKDLEKCLYALDFFASNSHWYTIITNDKDKITLNNLLKRLKIDPKSLALKAPFFTSKLLTFLANRAEFPYERTNI